MEKCLQLKKIEDIYNIITLQKTLEIMGCGCKSKKPVAKPVTQSSTQTTTQPNTQNNNGK